METNEIEVVEKRSVPKAASFILSAQIFERYSTAGISCKPHNDKEIAFKTKKQGNLNHPY